MCSIKCKARPYSLILCKDNECYSLKEKKKTVFIFVRNYGKDLFEIIFVYMPYHGCMDEEEKIGSDYVVNLEVKTDLSTSSKTDDP